MTAIQVIGGSMLALLALVLMVYATFTARKKGPLLANPWLWMSKEERKKAMENADLTAEYRQVTVVYTGLALLFALLAGGVFFTWDWVQYPIIGLAAILVVYAFASSVKSAMK